MKQPFVEIVVRGLKKDELYVLNENHVVRFWKANKGPKTDVIIELTTGETIRVISPTYDEWHDDCLQRKE